MSLHLVIPDPLAEGLEARAAASGVTAEDVAISAIKRELASPSLDEVLAPARKAYKESGISEDESFEFLEAEKHAMCEERRAAKK